MLIRVVLAQRLAYERETERLEVTAALEEPREISLEVPGTTCSRQRETPLSQDSGDPGDVQERRLRLVDVPD